MFLMFTGKLGLPLDRHNGTAPLRVLYFLQAHAFSMNELMFYEYHLMYIKYYFYGKKPVDYSALVDILLLR